MFDTIVQQQIASEQIDYEERLEQLRRLRIQSEVFTLGLLWERLFAPAYTLIESVQEQIPAGEWRVTDRTFVSGKQYYLTINMRAKTEASQQFIFDQFLEMFANSNTSLDMDSLNHSLILRLGTFILMLTIEIPVTQATLATLRDLGKLKTETDSREYLTCDLW